MKTSVTSTNRVVKRVIRSILLGVAIVSMASGPAGASGKSGGGSSGVPSTTGCASIVSLNARPQLDNGSTKFFVSGVVTNCGSAVTTFTTRVTDVSSHADAACGVRSFSYKWHSSSNPGESLYFWQVGGAGMCMGEVYTMKVDVTDGNAVLATSNVSWVPTV